MSVGGLTRILSAHTRRPARDLIADRVMLEAERLLRWTDHPVQRIARMLGYSDALWFSRQFSRRRGVSPTRCREAART